MAALINIQERSRPRILKPLKKNVITPQIIIDEWYRKQREKNIRLLNTQKEKGIVAKVDTLPLLPDSFMMGREEYEQNVRENYQRYLAQIANYRRKPLKFVRKELGINTKPFPNDLPPVGWKENHFNRLPLWTKQVEIIEALVKHRKVSVRSGHGAGKTYVAAIATLMLAYVFHALGITTAPTGRQVRRLLWGEIAKIYNHADGWQKSNGRPGLGGRLLTTSLELGDKWFVEGFSTDSKEANIPGFHEKTIFVVVDEAGGCAPEVFQLLETVLNSEDVYVLFIGNPIDPNTEFKKSFDPGSDYYPIHISCFDTPNVKHQRNIYPALCAAQWPSRMGRKFGKKSIYYVSRVEGNFPLENVDSLISYNSIIRAKEANFGTDSEIVSIGADVARLGGDRAVAGRRWANGRYREEVNFSKRRLPPFIGKLVLLYNECNELNKKFFAGTKDKRSDEAEEQDIISPVINVDDIGVGGGVTDTLLEQGLPANGINVAEKVAKGDSPDGQGKVKFKNKRAKYAWRLKEEFEAGRVDIDPEDDELEQELLALQISQNSKGELILVEKDSIKKKLNGRSPDKVEAMINAYAEADYLNVDEMLLW